MQELVLKCYGKLKIFLGKKIYDLTSPPPHSLIRSAVRETVQRNLYVPNLSFVSKYQVKNNKCLKRLHLSLEQKSNKVLGVDRVV